MVALKTTLEDECSKDMLTSIIGGLGKLVGTVLEEMNPSLKSLDLTGLGKTVDVLARTDFSSPLRVAETVGAEMGRIMVGSLPVPKELLKPLEMAFDAFDAQLDDGINRALTELEGRTERVATRLETSAERRADLYESVGVGRVAHLLFAVDRALLSPLAPPVLRMVSRATTGLDLETAWDLVDRNAAALAPTLALVRGLVNLEALSRDLVDAGSRIADPSSAGRLIATLDTLSHLVIDVDLPSLLNGIDPAIETQVDAAIGPILDFTGAVVTLADALVNEMSYGRALLTRLEIPAKLSALEESRSLFVETAALPLRALVDDLVRFLEPRIRFQLPKLPAGETALEYLSGEIGKLVTNLGSLDPAKIAKPLTDAISVALAPLKNLSEVFNRAMGAVEEGLKVVAKLATSLDLRSVADAIRNNLTPVLDGLEAIRGLIKSAQAEIAAVCNSVIMGMGKVEREFGKIKGTIQDAFEAIAGVIDGLELDQLWETLRGGVEDVTEALGSIPVKPVIDTVVEIFDKGADVLSAVPLSLLPPKARSALKDACAPILEIDFDEESGQLKADLRSLSDSLDRDVLDEIQAGFQTVIDFLKSLNPRLLLEQADESFDDLEERVRALNIEALLKPINEALEVAREALEGFSVKDLLKPLEAPFGELMTVFDETDPANLMDSLNEQIGGLRKLIESNVNLPLWADRVVKLDAGFASTLRALDPTSWLESFEKTVADAQSSGAFGYVLAEGAARVVSILGLPVPIDSILNVTSWAVSGNGANAVAERIKLATALTKAAAGQIGSLDVPALLADLKALHVRLVAAAAPHLQDSYLRMRLDGALDESEPIRLLGFATASQQLFVDSFTPALEALQRLEGIGWSEVDVAVAAIRQALQPLEGLIGERLRFVGDWLGVKSDQRSLSGYFGDLLAALRLSLLLGPFVTGFEALRAKVIDLVHNALAAPLLSAIGEIEKVIAAVKFPVPEELRTLHSDLKLKLAAFAPAALLGDLLDRVQQVLTDVAGFDPLGGVRLLVDEMKKQVAKVIENFRPSVLLDPLLKSYDGILEAAGGLDVRELLRPVLDLMDDLEGQLEDGLDGVSGALEKLQAACAQAGRASK